MQTKLICCEFENDMLAFCVQATLVLISGGFFFVSYTIIAKLRKTFIQINNLLYLYNFWIFLKYLLFVKNTNIGVMPVFL